MKTIIKNDKDVLNLSKFITFQYFKMIYLKNKKQSIFKA